MSVTRQTRFDVATLRDRAGEQAFTRGQAYHRGGQVTILTIDTTRVVARVAGTVDYRTEVTGRGEVIGGKCSCRAFEDWGFCKHMVAVALVANGLGGDAEAEGTDLLARIRDHLKKRGVDALVEMIVGLAEADTVLFRQLEMATVVASADDKTLAARVRKAIDQATDTRGGVDYNGVADWAAEVEAALDPIAQLAEAGRGALALDLVEQAIERIEDAMGLIDDSEGDASALLQRCGEIHLAAASTANLDPIEFAHSLFARETDGSEVFDGAANTYADVLGEAGLAEYHRLAAEAWDKLPPRSGGPAKRDGSVVDYGQLRHILDFFAERQGDVDARIALRAKDLSSPWLYFQLVQFCVAQGREDEALRYAEEGVWLFEDDRPDERLVSLAAEMLAKADRAKDAEALLQRVFAKAPSLALYIQLRAFGADARDQAIAVLQKRVDAKTMNRWVHPADLLVRVLMHETAFDQAWAVVRAHTLPLGLKEDLARASEATHQQEATEVYTKRVEQLANDGGNPAYAAAAELVARMGRLRSPAEQATYLVELKLRHGRKRNFMKLLG
jgi:uncharacterized Zn finger protein